MDRDRGISGTRVKCPSPSLSPRRWVPTTVKGGRRVERADIVHPQGNDSSLRKGPQSLEASVVRPKVRVEWERTDTLESAGGVKRRGTRGQKFGTPTGTGVQYPISLSTLLGPSVSSTSYLGFLFSNRRGSLTHCLISVLKDSDRQVLLQFVTHPK